MKRIELTWQDVEKQVQELLRQLHLDQWRPDYVVGLTRGGLIPANLISQYLNCRMETLKVSLRDGNECESNLWMAEDAFGYENGMRYDPTTGDAIPGKNILIVDDINDSGATLNWIQQDWMNSCLPDNERWNQVWGHNVRIACLYDNESSGSKLDVTYSAVTINKANKDVWLVFPWEDWWK
jgi:hypoxanthine phosphoribosyltransferase